MTKQEKGPPYKCRRPNCEESFDKVGDRDLHEQSVGHYFCGPCGIQFMKQSELNDHYKVKLISKKKYNGVLLIIFKGDHCKDLVCEVCGYDVRNGVPAGRRARILSKFYE